jgi:hypothetical protein
MGRSGEACSGRGMRDGVCLLVINFRVRRSKSEC